MAARSAHFFCAPVVQYSAASQSAFVVQSSSTLPRAWHVPVPAAQRKVSMQLRVPAAQGSPSCPGPTQAPPKHVVPGAQTPIELPTRKRHAPLDGGFVHVPAVAPAALLTHGASPGHAAPLPASTPHALPSARAVRP